MLDLGLAYANEPLRSRFFLGRETTWSVKSCRSSICDGKSLKCTKKPADSLHQSNDRDASLVFMAIDRTIFIDADGALLFFRCRVNESL